MPDNLRRHVAAVLSSLFFSLSLTSTRRQVDSGLSTYVWIPTFSPPRPPPYTEDWATASRDVVGADPGGGLALILAY